MSISIIGDGRISEMKRNPNTPKFWDKLVDKVDNIPLNDHITKDRIKYVVDLIPDERIKVLDIGLGYGFLEKEIKLKKQNVSIYGIDISKKSVIRARNLYGEKFVIGSAKTIPFSDNLFDVVCFLEVLEHIYENESNMVFNEIKRVLKNSGTLIISVPLYDRIYCGHPSAHVRFYTPEKLFRELPKNGFHTIKKRYLYAFSTLYKTKNIINKILKFKRPNNLVILARKK